MAASVQFNPGGDLARFVAALFDPTDLVTVRPIETWTEPEPGKPEPKKRSRIVYPSEGEYPAAVLADAKTCHDLAAMAERERANLFFGVCPRVGYSTAYNYAWQIRVVRCLWADLDHCLVLEARQRCAEAGLPGPSIIVASGHGVHLYWLLAEPYRIDDAPDPMPVVKEFVREPGKARMTCVPYSFDANGRPIPRADFPAVSPKGDRVQRVLAGIARKIDGDHTIDLSRILRLPGTLNRKDQRNGKQPVPCVLAECDPARRYPFAAFAGFAVDEAVKSRRKKEGTAGTNWTPPPASSEPALTDEEKVLLERLLKEDATFRVLWEAGDAGFKGPSEGDWHAATLLYRAGVKTIDRVCTILWASKRRREKWLTRPDWLEYTVGKAMTWVDSQGGRRSRPGRPGFQSGNLSARINSYLGRLPHPGDGSWRRVAFRFASFLVGDLAVSDDVALQWLRLWDQGNDPPRGPEALAAILRNAHAPRTSGLPTGADMRDPVGSGRDQGQPPPSGTSGVFPTGRPGHFILRCRVEVS